MTERPADQAQPMQEELTAYLDGELEANAARRVEERLGRDPDYQAELQRLQRAWDLLDGLPRATVDEAFTKTTLEMVAVKASEDVAALEVAAPRSRRIRQLAGAVGALAAGLIGFALGHALWPNPNEQLLKDLPVLQNFELYYQADNLDFLQKLDSEGLFAEGEGDHAG